MYLDIYSKMRRVYSDLKMYVLPYVHTYNVSSNRDILMQEITVGLTSKLEHVLRKLLYGTKPKKGKIFHQNRHVKQPLGSN